MNIIKQKLITITPSFLILFLVFVRLFKIYHWFFNILWWFCILLSAPFIAVAGYISQVIAPREMSGGWSVSSFDMIAGDSIPELLAFTIFGLIVNNFIFFKAKKLYSATNNKRRVILMISLLYIISIALSIYFFSVYL